MPPDLRSALERAVAKIVEAADPELIILFGSWAEGRATEDSDVDLLVVAETDRPLESAAALRPQVRQAGLTAPFDLLVASPATWTDMKRIPGHVLAEADHVGVRLYGAA